MRNRRSASPTRIQFELLLALTGLEVALVVAIASRGRLGSAAELLIAVLLSEFAG